MKVPICDPTVDFSPSILTENAADSTRAPAGIAPVVVHGTPVSAPLSGPLAGATRFFVWPFAMKPTPHPPNSSLIQSPDGWGRR